MLEIMIIAIYNQKQTNVKHIFTPHGDLRGTKQTIGINKNRSKGYFTSMRADS